MQLDQPYDPVTNPKGYDFDWQDEEGLWDFKKLTTLAERIKGKK